MPTPEFPTPDEKSTPPEVLRFYGDRVRNFMWSLFPTIRWSTQTVSEIIEDILVSPLSQLVLALLLFVLAYVRAVSVTVAVALGMAWFIAIFGVARSKRTKTLSHPTRLVVILSSALVLGFACVKFGKWSVQQTALHSQPQISKQQEQTTQKSSVRQSPPQLGSQSQVQPPTIGTEAKPPMATKPGPPSREKVGPELEGGFHEVTNTVTIVLGDGGLSVTRKLSDLKNRTEPFIPFIIARHVPVTLSLQDNKILFTFKAWGGRAGEPPIEVTNNEVKVRDPFVDRNHNDNAFEVVSEGGIPVFQMIRKTPTTISINGVFPIGLTKEGQPIFIWAWKGGYETGPLPPTGFVLKPIFKYPSWKYPGEYAKP